jgi:2-haloacid dehalogenase
MLDTLNAKPEDFLHISSHTRYDVHPMHDLGFRNLVLLDRGYDPVTTGYDMFSVKSLDEINKHLGL